VTAGLGYNTTASYLGRVTVLFTLSSGSGASAVVVDTALMTFLVSAVNTAPVITVNGGLSVVYGTWTSVGSSIVSFSDIDSTIFPSRTVRLTVLTSVH